MEWNLIKPKFNTKDFNLGRKAEVKWVVENLRGGGNLLDVGCLDSKFTDLMLPFYDDVWGIDIREFDDRDHNDPKPYNFVRGNIINYEFDFLFDEITLISTLEHIGLLYYTNKNLDLGSDKKTLDACCKILKPNGRILVTIPYSEARKGRYINNVMWERKYSKSRFDALVKSVLFGLETVDIIGRNINFILCKR